MSFMFFNYISLIIIIENKYLKDYFVIVCMSISKI